jgi:DNA-binding CsgD family transcriptional regulator
VIELDGENVNFTHPLLASTVYAEATQSDRRALHRRLARVVSRKEESARHLALAAAGPAEAVATALDEAAGIAASRGAADDAASLAEEAWRLTPSQHESERRRRLVDAAEYHAVAGGLGRARDLLERNVWSWPTGSDRGRAMLLLGRDAATADRSMQLWEQARVDASDDAPLLARIESDLVGYYVSELEIDRALDHARAELAFAERAADPELRASSLMDVSLNEFLLGHELPADLVQEALGLEQSCTSLRATQLPTVRYADILSTLGELDAARALCESGADVARVRGDEPALSRILARLSVLECDLGRYQRAREYASEAHALAVQVEIGKLRIGALLMIARAHVYMGDVDEALNALTEHDELSDRRGSLIERAFATAVRAFLNLSLGRPERVVDHALPIARTLVGTTVVEPGWALFSLPDLIEALVETGDHKEAASFVSVLERRGKATDRAWALAMGGRGRALLDTARGDFDRALTAVDYALHEHERLPMQFERGRTLLVRGLVLRTARQQRVARESFQQASDLFDRLGARLWKERAETELRSVPGRRPASPSGLTATEERIAQLVASGRSNQEVARVMFVSPKTVEWNLSKIYRKLHVRSRSELAAKLGSRR